MIAIDADEIRRLRARLANTGNFEPPHRWYAWDGWLIRPYDGLAMDCSATRIVRLSADRIETADLPSDPAVRVLAALFGRRFEPSMRATLARPPHAGSRVFVYGDVGEAWRRACALASGSTPSGDAAVIAGRGCYAIAETSGPVPDGALAVAVGSATQLLGMAAFDRGDVLAAIASVDPDAARVAVETGIVPAHDVLSTVHDFPWLAHVVEPAGSSLPMDEPALLVERARNALDPVIRPMVERAAGRTRHVLACGGGTVVLWGRSGLAGAHCDGRWVAIDPFTARVAWDDGVGCPSGCLSRWPPENSEEARRVAAMVAILPDVSVRTVLLAELRGLTLRGADADPLRLCWAAQGRRAPAVLGWTQTGMRGGAVVWRHRDGSTAATIPGYAVVVRPDGSVRAADQAGEIPPEDAPAPLTEAARTER